MPLLRKTLVCFYCGTSTGQRWTRGTRQFRCQTCDATNNLDENGEITDPAIPQTPALRYAVQPLSVPAPELAHSADDIFCRSCVHNQHIFHEALSNYLPEPSDPQYNEYERNLPKYRAELEERYPQICVNCAPRANQRLKAAAYAARSDHVRRQLLKNKSKPFDGTAVRAGWGWRTVAVIAGGFLWWLSVTLELTWHLLGLLPLAEGPEELKSHTLTVQAACALYALLSREVQQDCFATVTQTAKSGIIFGIVSMWYHPQLTKLLHNSGTKLNGYSEYLAFQVLTLSIRSFAWWFAAQNDLRESERQLHGLHAFMIVFTLLSSALSITTVRVNKQPLFSFTQPVPEIELPSAKLNDASDATGRSNTVANDSNSLVKKVQLAFPIHKLSGSAVPQDQSLPKLEELRRRRRAEDNDTGYGSGSENGSDDDSRSQITHQSMDWEPTTTKKTIHPKPTFAERMNLAMAKYPESPFALAANPNAAALARSPFYGSVPPAPESPAARLRKPKQPAPKKPPEPAQRNWFRDYREAAENASRQIDPGDEGSSLGSLPAPRGETPVAMQDPRLTFESSQDDTGLEDMFGPAISLGSRSSARTTPAGKSRRKLV